MRKSFSHLEQWRKQEPFPSNEGDPYGIFYIPSNDKRERERNHTYFVVIACDGVLGGWDHVSVHARFIKDSKLQMRCPTWDEMCYLKDLFFEDEECVMQLHPSKSNYVNNHPYVLHLWRPLTETIPTPPNLFV